MIQFDLIRQVDPAVADAMELELCDSWYILKEGVLQPFTYTGNVRELVDSL